MASLDQPTGGQVLLDGVDVRNYPLEELRGRIGMVLQTNILFSGTIRENLLWGNPEATEEEMIQAAKAPRPTTSSMSFPDGFDTYLDQGGVNVFVIRDGKPGSPKLLPR